MPRQPWLSWLLLFLLLVVAACSKPSRLPRLVPEAVILAFGDSLTYGTGATPGNDYPSQLAQLIGHPVVNAGAPGELTAQGLERLPGVLDANNPQLLVLIHGGNDMLRRLPPDTTEVNLRAMIRLAQDRGISVVLIGVPRPALLLLSSAEFYDRIAETELLPTDLETLPAILADPTLKSDPVHPNDAGYRRLAEAVADLLKRNGAID